MPHANSSSIPSEPSAGVGTASEASAVSSVSTLDLFLGFAKTGLRGFGGVLPWARRLVVEERAWLSSAEFTDVLSLCQFLPGPNIVNLSIVVGRRFQGARGALAAAVGLLLPPLAVVLLLALLYQRVAALPLVIAAMHGLSAAAAGLMLAMGLKMLVSVRHQRVAWPLAAAAFIAVAVLHWPLLPVLLTLAPLGIIVLRAYGHAA
jgi:chromate transporter